MDKKNFRRLAKILKIYIGIAGIFMIYALFVHFTGLGIPCIFRLITGLNCPGCGISRFCLDIMELHFSSAIAHNYAAPFIFFYIIWVLSDTAVRYVRTGIISLNPKPAWINYAFLILIVIWGIIRNILGI